MFLLIVIILIIRISILIRLRVFMAFAFAGSALDSNSVVLLRALIAGCGSLCGRCLGFRQKLVLGTGGWASPAGPGPLPWPGPWPSEHTSSRVVSARSNRYASVQNNEYATNEIKP